MLFRSLRRDLWQRLHSALEDAISTCLKDNETSENSAYALARALRSLGRASLKRLEEAPDCASQVIFAVRDVQRIALELLGIHEWMSVIRTRLNTRSAFPPGQYIGCFTSKLAEAEMLFRAGIPVWLIRTTSSITDSMDLGQEVEFVPVSSVMRLDRWLCVNGSYLHTKEIKDGGRIRDCTGLVYDAALSEMMEYVKSFSFFDLNNCTGEMEHQTTSGAAGTTAGELSVSLTITTTVGKRKGGNTDM